MEAQPDRSRPHPDPYVLDHCQRMSVCDLTGVERFIVWAIRWRASRQDDEEFAEECLRDSFERAGLSGAQRALEVFVCSTCPERLSCPASQRLGCWRLNRIEAHALHTIACLQAGLMGEAWQTLRTICPDRRIEPALEALQELGDALARMGAAINRWTRSVPVEAPAAVH